MLNSTTKKIITISLVIAVIASGLIYASVVERSAVSRIDLYQPVMNVVDTVLTPEPTIVLVNTASPSPGLVAPSALSSAETVQPEEATPAPQDIPLAPGERINVNTAPTEQLQRLPGIGVVKAQAIIDFRNANGPFTKASDLLKVYGIGDRTLENLQPYVRFSDE